MQDLMSVLLVEGHVVKFDFSPDLRKRHRLFRFRDGGLRLVDFPDLPVASHAGGKIVGQPAKHFHRPDDIHGIFHEGGQGAEGELPADHLAAAQQKHDEREQLGDEGKAGIILHENLRLLHVQLIIALVMGKKFFNLKFFPGEGLDGAHARQIFLRDGV